MSAETVKFSSYTEECARIQQAIQQEFPTIKIGDVHMSVIGKGEGNIVIPFRDKRDDILPSNLVVSISLDIPLSLDQIVQHARVFYTAIFQTFSGLSVDLSDPSRPQWSNKPRS